MSFQGCYLRDFLLPRDRFRSRAARARGLLRVTDCTSLSMISSEASVGEPELGVSSGAVTGVTGATAGGLFGVMPVEIRAGSGD